MSRSAFEVRAEPGHLPLQIAPLTFGADLDEMLLALFFLVVFAPDEDLLLAVDNCMVQPSLDRAASNKTEERPHLDAEESKRKGKKKSQPKGAR